VTGGPATVGAAGLPGPVRGGTAGPVMILIAGSMIFSISCRLHTVTEIAQTAGIHRTTVYDYLNKEG